MFRKERKTTRVVLCYLKNESGEASPEDLSEKKIQ